MDTKKYLRYLVLVGVPLLGLWFVVAVRSILLPFFVGFFLAYLFWPLVKYFEQKGLKRIWALLTVFGLLMLFFVLCCVFLVPKLISELQRLGVFVPTYIRLFEENNATIQNFIERNGIPVGLQQVIKAKLAGVEHQAIRIITKVLDSLLALVGHSLSLLLAPVLCFYLLKDKENLEQQLLLFIPQGVKGHFLAIVRDIDDVVSGFLKGHLLVCLLVGILTGVAMWLIGLPFALLLGVFAGIADLVPFFGPFIGAIPALMLAATESTRSVALVVVAIFVIQQIESNVISPQIMGDTLGIHPIMVIFALLAGGKLFGLVGLLLALPVAGIIRVIVRYLYLKLVEAH